MQPLDALVFAALAHGALLALLVAAIFSAVLFVKSIIDFTRTGPEMAEEVLTHYRLYLAYSLARLVGFAFLISAFLAFLGILAYAVSLILFGASYRPAVAVGAAVAAFLLLAGHATASAHLRRRLAHAWGDLACGGSGQARARRRLVGLLPPHRPRGTLRGDLLVFGQATRAGCGPAKVA
ncbi:MAG: hypothetical protein E6H64_16670 [Betaproteobacteria bacterium]|nr:MAG: hypothetical protein E6H64_16670 [Betaproteobacteria bacterium]